MIGVVWRHFGQSRLSSHFHEGFMTCTYSRVLVDCMIPQNMPTFEYYEKTVIKSFRILIKHWPDVSYQPGNSIWCKIRDTLGITQITKFMGPTWGPPRSCRSLMGPMLAPWTLPSGYAHGSRFADIVLGSDLTVLNLPIFFDVIPVCWRYNCATHLWCKNVNYLINEDIGVTIVTIYVNKSLFHFELKPLERYWM